MTESLHCYSFRQLSPFQGYYHIIETEGTQAVTRDGTAWQINVKTIVPAQGWGRPGENPSAGPCYSVFGSGTRG
ncbi:MAG: hypothetical protein PVF82_05465 [Gammaproteobacteria bacterium]|jgi:hypothetical protein